VTPPGNTPRQREVVAAFNKLDPRVKEALLVILEVVGEIEDRRRATRLLESIALLVALAPRTERTERGAH